MINSRCKDIQAMMDVNMYHPTALLKKFLPGLKQREKQSGVIFVSSVQGFAVVPACTVYSASKAYIANLALAVQAELAGEGCTSVDT